MKERIYLSMPNFKHPFRADALFQGLLRNGWIFECDSILDSPPVPLILAFRNKIEELLELQSQKLPVFHNLTLAKQNLFRLLFLWCSLVLIQPFAMMRIILGHYSWRKLSWFVYGFILVIAVLGLKYGLLAMFIAIGIVALVASGHAIQLHQHHTKMKEQFLIREDALMKEIIILRDQLQEQSFLICLPHLHVIHTSPTVVEDTREHVQLEEKIVLLSNQTKGSKVFVFK